MSSPLSVKRRKLNDATDKLKKPFVSPMRSRKPIQPPMKTPLRDNASTINATWPAYTPSTLAHTIKASDPAPEVLSSTAAPANTVATPQWKQSPLARSTQRKKKTDPEEAVAQRVIMALELQIRRVQNDLDVLKQAESLSGSSTDADLAELKDKWRLASQCAAEELFGSVKERVCRMGGVAAWREMEKKKHQRANGVGEFAQPEVVDDDADCEFDSQGEELPEAEQEYRKKMKHKAKQEALEAMDEPDKPVEQGSAKDKVWQEDGQDDDTFTMDMMLRSLNIELSVIGYDKQQQKWV